MKKVSYNQYFNEATESLSDNGAFLTVKSDNKLNTMTIGWATIGYIWGKKIMIVAVRKSRYTYQLIKESNEFTVSIPFNNKMKEELKFCGTKSGREYDKFKECNLKKQPSEMVNTPLIKGCDLHYECIIKYNQLMNIENLAESISKSYYQNDDYHTFYFGEIVNCYREE